MLKYFGIGFIFINLFLFWWRLDNYGIEKDFCMVIKQTSGCYVISMTKQDLCLTLFNEPGDCVYDDHQIIECWSFSSKYQQPKCQYNFFNSDLNNLVNKSEEFNKNLMYLYGMRVFYGLAFLFGIYFLR